MIVKVDSVLFNHSSFHSGLDKIFDMFIEGRYDGYVKDYSIDETEWYNGARPDKQNFFKELLSKSVNYNKPDITISETNDIPNKQFSLIDGIVYLNNRVLIFLENSYNDERFIRSILSRFKSGEKASLFLKKNWLDIKNCAGSGGVETQIYAEIRKFRDYELDNHEYIRAFVIIDSDKKHPKHIVDKSKIEEVCNKLNIELHILEKREMENYLPLEILELDADVDLEIINSIKKMTPIQLDHYDFELGFDVTSPNHMEAKYSKLYENISKEDFNILKLGFRKTNFKTKTQIPQLFLKNELTREMLLERCSHQTDPDELERIIKKINKLI